MTRRYHLNLPIVIYSVLLTLLSMAALNSQNNLLFWLCGLTVAGLLLSGLISGVMM